MKVIIIGSGISGLTAGAYFAREGHQVIIYEQFSKIGGVTATIQQDGFSWDIGPLLLEGFAPHEKLAKLLMELGIYNDVEYIREDRGQSFPDFQIWRPEKYQGYYWRREYFKRLFPGDADGIDAYYKFYDQMMALSYVGNQLPFVSGFKAFTIKLRLFFKFLRVKKYQTWSAKQITDYFFNNEMLKAVFLGILADMVVKPSEFFGLGLPLFNVETVFDKRIPINFAGGKFPTYHYIKNGCGELVKALANLIEKHGGKIHTKTKVTKIAIEGNQAKGIQLEDGSIEYSDVVIASGGMFNTFYNMVGKDHLTKEYLDKIENNTLMDSVFMVHLGIDFDPSQFQRAALCYYYLNYDIEGAINVIRSGVYHEGKDGFLIYIPSMHSPEMAPKGKYAVTIYTVAPHKLKNGTWNEKQNDFADKLIMEAEKIIPGLYEGSEVKIIMTPDDFKKRLNVLRHTFGGTAPAMGEENPSHQTPVDRLWYIGAYSESGGGVMGAAMGARDVARRILQGT